MKFTSTTSVKLLMISWLSLTVQGEIPSRGYGQDPNDSAPTDSKKSRLLYKPAPKSDPILMADQTKDRPLSDTGFSETQDILASAKGAIEPPSSDEGTRKASTPHRPSSQSLLKRAFKSPVLTNIFLGAAMVAAVKWIRRSSHKHHCAHCQ